MRNEGRYMMAKWEEDWSMVHASTQLNKVIYTDFASGNKISRLLTRNLDELKNKFYHIVRKVRRETEHHKTFGFEW